MPAVFFLVLILLESVGEYASGTNHTYLQMAMQSFQEFLVDSFVKKITLFKMCAAKMKV